jgi:hypothetical protein
VAGPLTPDMPENQALDLPLGLRRAAARRPIDSCSIA